MQTPNVLAGVLGALLFLVGPALSLGKTKPQLSDPPKSTGDDGAITLTLSKPTEVPATATTGDLIDSFGKISGTACRQTALGNCPAYIIVNLVDWQTAQAPKSKWTLIHSNDHRLGSLTAPILADSTTRIYGSKLVGLLVIHENITNLAASNVSYSITAKGKQSVQLADFTALVNLIAGGIKAFRTDTDSFLVGARLIDNITSLPSDIAITGQVGAKQTPGQKSTGTAASFAKTYDDEGFSHWDAAVAVPVMGVKETDYSSSGGVVVSKVSSKAYSYGMFHYYFRSEDLKGDYPWLPSLVGGLPLSGRTLTKPFAGLAFGIKKPLPFQINPFAGVVFNKAFYPRTLKVGDPATPAQLASDLTSRREYKLLVGIDIPVAQFVKLKKSNTSSTTQKSSTGNGAQPTPPNNGGGAPTS
jgi:hypothetical protein